MRRTSVAAAVAALALLAAGCGEEAEEGPLKVGDGSSTTDEPSSTTSEDGSPEETEQTFDEEGHEALRGTTEADTPEEEAVADAWFAYWTVRADSYGKAKVDPQLGSVAAADAVSDVVRYVAYLRSKDLRTVGDTRFDVRDIEVQGNSASLYACATNKSIDQTADGTPAEQPVAFFSSTGALVKRAGTWRVVSVPIETSSSRC